MSLRAPLLVTCATCAMLAACASSPDRGIVRDKRYTKQSIQNIVHPQGLGGIPTMYTQTFIFPERWELLVHGDGQECWVEVSRDEFERAVVGKLWIARR